MNNSAYNVFLDNYNAHSYSGNNFKPNRNDNQNNTLVRSHLKTQKIRFYLKLKLKIILRTPKLSTTLQKQFKNSLNDSYQSVSELSKRPAPLYQKKQVQTSMNRSHLKPVIFT